MRLISNEELMVVAGGDLEPDEPIQTVEISSPRMTDEEKAQFDYDVNRFVSEMDSCLTGNPVACASFFTGVDWPEMPDLPNLIDWNSFGN
ncbi:hypothetical protein UNDYM_0515 [Undibacterium sp. YM2]|uniref:hypothetical protein n=1 Tax=Undibacterium sp. YM2 TaxID=2058625 RepID=UPI001331FA9B|nr:hypothetical protein [Undibacterium sp. YM2]BBB64768.1 hypothetical protein UNDYM_0515 [Undibacterium sp. YM2]